MSLETFNLNNKSENCFQIMSNNTFLNHNIENTSVSTEKNNELKVKTIIPIENFLDLVDYSSTKEITNYFSPACFKLKKSTLNFSFEGKPLNRKKFDNFKNQKTRNYALRNIKSNFGSNIINFVKFLAEIQKENSQKFNNYKEIYTWLKKNCQKLRSYLGWQELMMDNIYGLKFRKICKAYFGKSFAVSYLKSSRIKKEYRNYYSKAVEFFNSALKNPSKFLSKNLHI